MKKLNLVCALLAASFSVTSMASNGVKCSLEVEFSNGTYLNDAGIETVGMSDVSVADARAYVGKIISKKGYSIADEASASSENKLELSLITGIPDGKIYGSYSRFTSPGIEASVSSELSVFSVLSSSNKGLTLKAYKKTLNKLVKLIPSCN